MSLIRYIKKLQLIDYLISKKATGNQQEFCRKAAMSRSHLNNYLNEMKELGFPIEYDRLRETYYYREEGKLVSKLFQLKLDSKEMSHIQGGRSVIVQECNYWESSALILPLKLGFETLAITI